MQTSRPGRSLTELALGLLAQFPFSGNANDASGNHRNGVVSGATLTTNRLGVANSAYAFNGVHLGTALGAPVSDPAGIEKGLETRRIGDRRSAMPIESGAASCAPFNGSQSMSVANLDLDHYPAGCSFGCWFRPDLTNSGVLFYWINDGAAGATFLVHGGGGFSLRCGTGSGISNHNIGV